MYRMLYNDSFLFDPFDETRIVSSASITTNVNAASYLDFTIAANHPLYNEIEQRSGIITLYSDNEKLYQGQITAIDMDMDGNKSVTCSSALDWLRDVQLRPYSTDQAECDEYEFKLDKAPDALDAYFQWLIDQYNAQNKDGRYFTIKVNQAADLTQQSIVYFASTSPRSVADAIEDDILGTFGGYLVLRYEDDQLILDLYSDIHEMNEQVIDYGENILDISRSESTDDQYTAVYPIGKTPQYTAEQQKYHDEKAIYDEYMKQRDETENAAIAQLQKEEEAEQKRITGMPNGQAKRDAENALKKRKEQRQARETAFSDETKSLQDAQKIKDDKNAADKTKPNPITIESLDNGGYPGDLDIFKEGDVVYSVSYVQRYGYKEFVYNDTDVEDKQLLLMLAVAKLKSLMAPSLTIDVRAVDQALYNPKHTHLFAGQAVRVRSKPHGVDEFMMVSSIDLDLIDPSRTTATLGVAYDTLTGQQSSFLRNLNSKIVASVDAVDKLGEDVKVTETTLGRVETAVDKVAADNELIVNTVGDYKWMTDTAWGKAEDAQESADEANRGVTDTNVRIDNIKMETDERIDGIHDDIDNTKEEVEQAKQTAEQIRQEAQTGVQEAKDKTFEVEQNLDGFKQTVTESYLKKDDAETEYTSKSEFTQTADEIRGTVAEQATTVNGHTDSITTLSLKATKFESDISQTSDQVTGILSRTSTLEQDLGGFKQTVSETYATKTQLSDEMRLSVKTFELRGRTDGNYWLKMGRVTMAQQGKDFHIDYTGGRGFNGDPNQNSRLEIHVRSGSGAGTLFGVTLNRLLNADAYTIKAFAIDSTHIDLYMKSGSQYNPGTVAYYGQYSDFSGAKQIEDISTAEGTELTVLEQSLSTQSYVKQTAESVSIGVVEEFKDGKHGDKLTTQSNLTALKDEINLGVSEQYADLSDQIKLANSDNAIGKNFSFESNNFDGWASHDNWTIGTEGAHTGRYYAQNTIPVGSNGNQLISAGSISAEYGHTYKVEYWVKKKPNTECRGIHRISYKRSGRWEDLPSDYGTTIFLDEEGKTNIIAGAGGGYFSVTDSWMKVTSYIIPPSNVTDIRVRIIAFNPGSVETVYAVDDVSLTDYSVAKTINTTMAGINVKTDSIVQEVRNDYATKDLVNRSIPGLKNPNFDAQKDGDNTVAGWSALGPWDETRLSNSTPVGSESKTYFVGKSGTTADQTLELINQGYISAYPGMKVQISWWMSVDANIIQNSNFSAGIIANDVVTRNLLSNYSTGGWKYMTTTVEVPANVSQFRVRFGFVTTGTSGWLRLDSVSVTDVTEAKAALGKATTVETNLENYKITVKDTYVDNDTVKGMQTQWNQTAKGFEASIKASSSSISVVNPGFETGDTTGWTATNFKNITVLDNAIFQNTTHRFLGYRDGYNMPILANEGTVTARKNDYIKVSARILFLDGSNNSLGGWMSIGVMNSYSGIVHLGDVDITGDGWNTVSYNVQVPEDGLYSVWLVFPSTIDESTKILVDDVTMANETEAIHADSRINALETRIAMTSEGVRVGKIENGTFQGTSALMNSEGSFDILQGEEAVATLRSDYVGLMRDSDTDKYRFGVRPYEEHSTGSVDYTYEGVDLQTVGGFSLNGIPAAPASDILTIRPTQTTGNNYFIKYNVDGLKNDNAIFLNAAVLHRDYYQRLDEGKPALAVHFKHAVGLTTTKDGDIDVSNDHIDTQVMALNPCLYGIQFVVNAQKNTAISYLDATIKVLKTGESTWIESSALPAFRVIEVGDPVGWLTRTSPMYFVKLDVGYRFGIYITGSTNDFKLGSLNKIIITRMPFSGERMD